MERSTTVDDEFVELIPPMDSAMADKLFDAWVRREGLERDALGADTHRDVIKSGSHNTICRYRVRQGLVRAGGLELPLCAVLAPPARHQISPAPATDERTGLPSDFFHRPEHQRRAAALSMATRTPGSVNPGLLKWTALEGDPAMIRRLTAVAELDPDEAAKRTAVCGLARMSDRAAIPGLLIGLSTTDRATRRWAITGLEKRQARDAVPELVQLLSDWHLRHIAARALVAIRDERGLQPLRSVSRRGWPLTRVRMRRRVRTLERELGY